MTKTQLDMAGASDNGCTRSENQDHFLIADLRRQLIIRDTELSENERDEMFGCREGNLLVVADGMGGHQGCEPDTHRLLRAGRDALVFETTTRQRAGLCR